MKSISEQLALWVTELHWDDIPHNIRQTIKLHILDVVGVMLAAKPTEVVEAAATAMTAVANGTAAKALGHAQSYSLAGAAFVNGVMSSVMEFDDTHIESYVHSTIAPFSIALAHCQSAHLSGSQLMQAVIIGSELGCRLGLVPPRRLHSIGIHPTAIMGTLSAVYSLGKLQNLNTRQLIHAIGHSASMCGGLMASWEDGASTKTLHVGMAASQAVLAVALARVGISGPESVFDGRYSWFRTHVQGIPPSEFRLLRATQRLGEDWEILNIASKPYPSAFTIHPYVDAVLALKSMHHIDPCAIAEIWCEVAPSSVATICEPITEKLRPMTPWHGRISLQHSLAEALIVGSMDKTSYGSQALGNPAIQALADKVRYRVRPDGMLDARKAGADVTITLNDGTSWQHVIDSVRGTRDNPISQEDYAKKFRSNADGVIPPALVEQTIEGLMNLENQDDIAPLFDRLTV